MNPVIMDGTPVELHRGDDWGPLWVKREDLSSPPPGPPFSKARGVYAHLKNRPECVIGVLDTSHSQAGHAVARACQVLGKSTINYWPCRKANILREPGEAQFRSSHLGAKLVALPAGRSFLLYHAAKKHLASMEWCTADFMDTAGPGDFTTYMMPNALQLPESVQETALEVGRTPSTVWDRVTHVIVPASSATLAAGVIRGLAEIKWRGDVTVHMGYSRSHDAVMRHISAFPTPFDISATRINVHLVDEGYEYADRARPGSTPPWPCNEFYDLKAFRWWERAGNHDRPTLLWNIG